MYKYFFKRLLDVMIALSVLPFVLLVIIIFGLIIYLTDKGPIFYNAERVGRNFKTFKMYKLRSMRVNAPDIRNADGSTYNSDNDPRVTPIGRFMRKASIDEVPQFVNVLIGDMSMVGPRPILPSNDYSSVIEYLQKSIKIKPGITGYNQAYYRNSVTRIEKYRNDAYYADHVSFFFDIRIIWYTVLNVLRNRNINTN
ncbi:MAG: sugar transferase [Prevotellaceae bacterium]|jgi:lipopolysaccharide/colanic/teichoic acid biosynthesis glycosyltransferase|nr:sugar transferase [Prevotellaceae bacterium]